MRPIPALPNTAIIVGGKRFEVTGPTRVVTWHEHKKPVRAGRGHNKPRRQPIDLCVIHWTGGENPPLVVADVLAARRLGSEFIVSTDGVIYQFCDPLEVDTADAGTVNARSVGIEVVNYGIRRFGPRPDGGKLPSFFKVPVLGRQRATHEETIHGVRRTVADFYPAQIAATAYLVRALYKALGLSLQLPRDAEGVILSRALTLLELAQHKGVVGHFHVTDSKLDPGVRFLEQLGARWML